MVKERTINGKRCRLYTENYTWAWIADTGDFASHYVKGGGYKGSFRILKDNNGPFFKDSYRGVIRLARAVITCFCPPLPNNGASYMINHKDGNWMNCNYKNLEWAPYHYRHTTLDKIRLILGDDFVEVFSDGKIKIDGKEQSVREYIFDSDMDLFTVGLKTGPHIIIGRERVSVEKIMTAAGYVQGDDAPLTNPVILHIDGNWLNFASDNLEWVEQDDPRYTNYCKKKISDMEARSKELNKGRSAPDYWL